MTNLEIKGFMTSHEIKDWEENLCTLEGKL